MRKTLTSPKSRQLTSLTCKGVSVTARAVTIESQFKLSSVALSTLLTGWTLANGAENASNYLQHLLHMDNKNICLLSLF